MGVSNRVLRGGLTQEGPYPGGQGATEAEGEPQRKPRSEVRRTRRWVPLWEKAEVMQRWGREIIAEEVLRIEEGVRPLLICTRASVSPSIKWG